jgi:membrane-bound lytic murein transglycosylase D
VNAFSKGGRVVLEASLSFPRRLSDKPPYRFFGLVLGLAVSAPANAADSPAPPASKPATPPTAQPDTDALLQAGQQLFDQLAPPEVKAQYAFPTKEQWESFTARLQGALESGSMDDLAAYAPQARTTLTALRTMGVEPELTDWLEQRLDELEGAQEVQALPQPAPRPAPNLPAPGVRPVAPVLPYFDLWLTRERSRPVPARANELIPILRRAFAAEGVPPSLAWLAEAESSMNPNARSPAGAKGLFQLMPDTAHTLGLGTFLPDERTNPEKSARAAAHYLNELHQQFGNWPLALAAYNAGPGRVSRALMARHAKDFAGVADALPAETRMYVPKVCALVATRTGESIAGK